MERHFGIPIALAAALHVALLFGVNPAPRLKLPVIKDSPDKYRYFPMPVIDDVPIATDLPAGEKATPSAVAPPAISSPELPAIKTDESFTMPVPPIVHDGVDLKQIPTDLPRFGPGDGQGMFPGGVLSAVELDEPPRARFQPAPIFPHEARRDGQRGEVIVQFLVDEEGRVLEPRVVSSTHGMFDASTLQAVAKWRFHPGRSSGRIVRFRMSVPVVFTTTD